MADGINRLSYAELNRRANRPQAYILNPALELVPPGVSGELCLGGDGPARGDRPLV